MRIPYIPLDNESFHKVESVTNYNFVYHQRLTPKRELYVDTQKCNGRMELLSDAQLLTTVTDI